jgi:sugar/nucleoside kinase (ribokinase family)
MSDFRHGLFTKEDIPAITDSIPEGRLRVADSQVASRWGNILDFANFDLITPNEKEARFAIGDQDSVIRPLASELYRRSGCRLLVLKMGDRGVMVHRGATDSVRDFFQIDSFVDELVDPVGAGDALLAYTSVIFRSSEHPVVAAILGTMAAGVACENDGNSPVTPDQVREKLASIERHLAYR